MINIVITLWNLNLGIFHLMGYFVEAAIQYSQWLSEICMNMHVHKVSLENVGKYCF